MMGRVDWNKLRREHDERAASDAPKRMVAPDMARMAAAAGFTQDDPGPKSCTECGRDVPSIDSPYGWCHDVMPSGACRDCHNATEAQQAKRAERDRQAAAREAGSRALSRMIAGYPKRFRAATFDDLAGGMRMRAEAWLSGESWLLFFFGVTGAGKTHAGYATMHQWAITHISELATEMPHHYYAPDLYRLVQSEATLDNPSTGTTAKLIATPAIVMIDDLGVGKPTPWAIQEVQRIIHHREQEELPTIVTTNLPLTGDGKSGDDLTAMFSARFVRRLTDGIPIDMPKRFTGESQR
jgi:DNA replication protein DnaC